MSDEQIVFLKNNLSLRDANGVYDILLYQNSQYWNKEHNLKSNTTRYACCQKAKNKCFASITIRNSNHTIARGKNNIRWKCEKTGTKTQVKCLGRAHTGSLLNGPVTVTREHNHIPVPEKEDCILAVQAMLEKASITNERPRTLIKRHQFEISNESASYMLRTNQIRQRMN
ncbi:hypothetical protein BpHYR1_013246 [Brachionus plicatilis]|uniref:FLYWCH-type domain-containing protein n=1 Tax=Brachionus plicatilis TaxID=10195 RepID=A0A3M7S161_BRAPC|nr:hypothetical protein BpHYR1_013246 [Brachionus plicatilis]